MKRHLSLLEELQSIDCLIDKKCLTQKNLHTDICFCQQEITIIRQTYEENLGMAKELEHQKSTLECTLNSELDNIKRSETNAKEIKTNKEFQAIDREINAARKQVTELEEQILNLTAQLETLQIDLGSRLAELQEKEAQGKALEKEKKATINSLQEEINNAASTRETVSAGIPASLIRRYQQLREQRRGVALSTVENGSCLGCNMQLPPQLYNMLIKGEELLYCPHCQRILLLKTETGQEAA